tara:strand:- start:442 stop:1020 length:579 start_codon:yes stop_codon:yes gene_type:complete
MSPVDDEWARLPRRNVHLLKLITSSAPRFDASELFRNAKLNPADQYIPKGLRSELASTLSMALPGFIGFKKKANEAYSLGFEIARERGSMTKLSKEVVKRIVKVDPNTGETRYSIREADRAGVQVVMFDPDGGLSGTTRAELPGCRDVVEMEKYLECSFGVEIVGWFEWIGALDHARAQAIRQQLFKHAERD